MKRLFALACLMSAVPAWAADVGLGVSAKSNDSAIYVPIDFGNSWRLEPFVNYAEVKSDSGFGGNAKSHALQLGTGIFGVRPLGESLHLYYGGRLAYLDVENAIYSTPWGTTSEKGDGYRITPTLGFEYAFNQHVSLGGEAGWFYEEVNFGQGFDQKRNGTDTRLILRFRF